MSELVLPPPPTPIKSKRTVQKRTDPNYFKNYYQNKTKLIKMHCDICNKDFEKSNFSKHNKSIKHVNNENMIKYKELCRILKQRWYEENYSEFD